MFKRVLWLGIGVGIGVLVIRKLTQTAESFTPKGIAGQIGDSAGGLLGEVRSFIDDVRNGAAEREAEIHAAFADGALITDYVEEESDGY
ncbi:DUF6167 family protein [Longispora albida]|uniref:DUF6167 family protein n=1 Tax=Longispora albida TaxID=203523 RepID=UPI00036F27AF|nr:DUF6167 family protein [Longispora albida]